MRAKFGMCTKPKTKSPKLKTQNSKCAQNSMRITEENVLKIVGMHLNKTNRTTKSVTQLGSLSKGLANTLGVTGNKQVRFVKAQIVDFVNGFLKKRKGNTFIETEIAKFSERNLRFLKIRYDVKKFFNDSEEFMNYYSYYYFVGQYKKEDFVTDWGLSFEDPESYFRNRKPFYPLIYIKHEHMKAILKNPTSQRLGHTLSPRAIKILMKKVYNRSRTHGFFKPSEVDKYANMLIEEFITSSPRFLIRR